MDGFGLMAVRFHLPSKVYGHDNAAGGVERGNIVSWRQDVGQGLADGFLAFGATIDSFAVLLGHNFLRDQALVDVARRYTVQAAKP